MFALLFICLFPLLSHSQKPDNNKLHENPTSFYLGLENRYYIMDSLLQKPFLKSSEAEVISMDKYFIVNLRLPQRDSIRLEINDIRNNDTFHIKTISIPEKRLPDPVFSIEGKLIGDSISKEALVRAGEINVMLGDPYLDKYLNFELTSFDLEVDGKQFHSNSNRLTPSMIFCIKKSKSLTLRITNDMVYLKTGDKLPRVIYGDKTFFLMK